MADNDITLRMILAGEDRSASKALRGVGKSAEETGKKTKLAGAVMKGALSAAVIERAATAVFDFGRDSIEAYRGAAASQRQLSDAYKRFPSLADVSIGKLRSLAAAIEAKTGADADDIASGQAVLARYKLTGSQVAKMTPLMVDYAKRTGKEIPAASGVLGKAIMGNGRAMKELGVKFKDTKDPAKNFELIMAGLKEKVGGFANSEATTLDGKLEILHTKFGNLQESIGEKLLPVVVQLADGASKLVDYIAANASWLGPMAAAVGVATAAFWLLNAAMAANPISLIVLAIGALVAGLIYAYNNVGWFRDGVNAAFKGIADAGRWLWNNALAPVLRAILGGFAWVVEGLANMLDALGNVPGFEWAKDAATGLRGLAKNAKAAADGIKNIPDPALKGTKAVNKLDKTIKGLKSKIVTAKAKGDDKELKKLEAKLKAAEKKKHKIYIAVEGQLRNNHIKLNISRGGQTGVMRMYASGGRPKVGQPAIVGENGWEVFVPDTAGRILNQRQLVNAGGAASVGLAAASSSSGGLTITINGAIDPVAVGRQVEGALNKYSRSTGGRGFSAR